MTQAEATLATRQHFANVIAECIADARSGKLKVNDIERYIREWGDDLSRTINGEYDHTFTHRQHAHYLLTGECFALLT